MAEIVIAVAAEVGKGFVAPIKKHFSYICCFNANLKELSDAARALDDVRAGVQMQLGVSNRNGELILPQVHTWLADADEAQVTARRIETQIPGILKRYSLSRKAKKTAESMRELRDSGKFSLVSQPALPASMGTTPSTRGTLGIESRKETEDDIITAMRCGKVNVIGVCGMGGVGKTTMAKQIINRSMEEKALFDEVVMVVVGQQMDTLKIQKDIADWLGLKFDEETLAPRAHRLQARLMGGKRKLIVIDDVWERVDLESLGIPCQTGQSCTVLLTSRDMGVCHQMSAQRVFIIQILYEEEAWLMFKENVGDCVDDLNLLPIARDVVKECNGLPLALVAVAKALKGSLKGNVSKPILLDALKQLRSSSTLDMPYVIAEVYNPIKLSYEFLANQNAKSLLFLCSLFPEDHDISLEDLMFYGVGLCMFEGMNNLEEARNRIVMLVEMLKSRFLILDGKSEHYVKMHDVVRDVTIFIASTEKHAILEFSSMDWTRQNSHSDCTMISVVPKERRVELPIELTFPRINVLWMDNSEYRQLEISDHIFKGMQQLRVLYIKSFSLLSTPQTTNLLKNLRTLHLVSCSLERLSVVGELSSLEILCFRYCDSITELPVDIGRLSRLRLLEVSHCSRLKTIMPNVISRLGRLEELKMLNSFKGWESEEKESERSNVSLSELESLCNLTCLEIEIEDCTLAEQELQLSSKIVKYDIQVGEKMFFPSHEKKLYLNLPIETTIGNWIHVFARSAESLHLEGDGSNSFDFAGHQNLRWCTIIKCWTVVTLVSHASTDWRFGVFTLLEKLCLQSLPNLEEICNGPIPMRSKSFAKLQELQLVSLPGLMRLWRSRTQEISLSNLSSIGISGCGNLCSLFSSAMLIRSLSQLETLEITMCDSMEEVFSIEEEKDGENLISFPKLKRLVLSNLKSLTSFCKGIDIIEFPRLVDLSIADCPKLVSFIASDQSNLKSSTHDSINLFCDRKLTFGSLKKLGIGGYKDISYVWCRHIPRSLFGELEELFVGSCININNLFSDSVAGNLVNLRVLTIKRCDEMVQVIAEDTGTPEKTLIFHKLEWVQLLFLPRLQIFCEGRCGLQLPSLVRVDIWECPKMKGFAMGSLSTSNLKEFFVEREEKNAEDIIGYPWL